MIRDVFFDVLASFGIFVLGIIATWFWKARHTRERVKLEIARGHTALVEEVGNLRQKIAVLETSLLPINAVYQAILVKELTHFHTPETDRLLEKLGPPITLTEAEEKELYAAMDKRMLDQGDLITESERGAAKILPEVIKRSRAEAKMLACEAGVSVLVRITRVASSAAEV